MFLKGFEALNVSNSTWQLWLFWLLLNGSENESHLAQYNITGLHLFLYLWCIIIYNFFFNGTMFTNCAKQLWFHHIYINFFLCIFACTTLFILNSFCHALYMHLKWISWNNFNSIQFNLHIPNPPFTYNEWLYT